MKWLSRNSDSVLAGLLVAVYLGEVLLADPRPWQLLMTIPPLAAAIWLRRRFPIPAMVGGIAVMIWSTRIGDEFFENGGLTFLFVWLLLHYSLGRWTTGMAAWAGPPLVIASTILIGYEDSGSFTDTGDLAYFLSLAALPWVAGLVARLRADHVAALHEENIRLALEKEEAARRAVAEERARLARELHDVVSHAISVTVLQARGARWQLGRDEAEVRKALATIEQTNTAALGDMRRLLAVLRDTEDERPDGHAPQPTLENVEKLIAQMRDSGMDVDLEVDGQAVDVPPGVDLSGYRIVQEALTNVTRHAVGANVRVSLQYQPDALTIAVRDSGGTPGAGEGSGHGLLGIRERVAVVGGELEAGPAPDGGFELRARMPYALEVS